MRGSIMIDAVEINLKSCPFCGSRAVLTYDNQEDQQIYCDDCDFMMLEDLDKDAVIEKMQ